jgi:outer membrane protein assembly factor BamB
MKRQTILLLTIGLATIIIVSSLLIYTNSTFNPTGSSSSWQRPIENFATGIAADDSKIYVMDINGNVGAYSTQTGASLWNSSADIGYFASGIVQSADKVYGGGQVAAVGCVDKATGKFQWSFWGEIGTDLWSKRAPDAIIVNGGVVASVDGGVSVHDAKTGEFLWQASRPYNISVSFGNLTDLSNWWVAAYPLGGDPFEGNFAYLLSGNYSNPYISKFNFETASFVWSSNITLRSVPFAYPEGIPGYSGNTVSVIAMYQGQVVIQNSNQILSFNDTTGDQLWSINLNASTYHPTASKGTLFFGASDGNFYALNLSDGAIQWKTKVDNQNLIPTINNDNITLTTYPIQIQNSQVYWSFGATHQLGTNSENKHDTYAGTVCSLNLATGSVVWSRQMEDSGQLYSPPVGLVVNKDTLYLTENMRLWVFNALSGALVKNSQFDHYVLPPVTSDDKVIVASDLELTAYK